MVSDHYRLFLITSDNINTIPDIVISLTTVVLFYPEKKGIRDLILTLFLQKFYPKVYSERTKLNEVVYPKPSNINDTLKLVIFMIVDLNLVIAHQYSLTVNHQSTSDCFIREY